MHALGLVEHAYTFYSLQKDARILYRKLKHAWEVIQSLKDMFTNPLLILLSGIERVQAKLVFFSVLLVAVFLPILILAGAGRTSIKPGWRFAR